MFSTRARAIITTFVSLILFIFIQTNVIQVSLFESLILNRLVLSGILFLIVYLGVCWTVFFKLKLRNLLTIPFFPALFATVYSIFAQLSLFQIFERVIGGFYLVALVLGFGVLLYAFILNANILNSSHTTGIPLERAARTTQYIFSLLISYISYAVVFALDIHIVIKLIIFAVLIFLITTQALSAKSLTPSQLTSNSVLLTVVIFLVGVALMLWPTTPQFAALMLTAVCYLLYGVALEHGNNLSTLSKVEYFFVIMIVFGFLLYSSIWAMNGKMWPFNY